MTEIINCRILLTIAVLCTCLTFSVSAQVTPPSAPEDCKSALVMEASSGEVIYQLNPDLQLAPASMTKMMLVLITMEQIKEGELNLEDIITTSAKASRMGGSQVYLAHNEEFSLQDLLKAVLIQSANDASLAIAEYIAGSSDGFVDMMNARAVKLGLTNTIYHTPHGLPPGKNQEPDLTSAHDLAILAREIVIKHPEVLKWSSLDKEPFRQGKFIMTNTNRLVNQFSGCDGLKTGYYRSAGFSVTATAQQDGVRIIAIVMGCEKNRKRFAEASRLMKWGLRQYKKIDLIEGGTPAGRAIPVIDGVQVETVPIVDQKQQAVIRKDRIESVVMKTTLERDLTAPVQAGQVCGYISFVIDDKEIARTDLLTADDIQALNWWGKLKRTVGL